MVATPVYPDLSDSQIPAVRIVLTAYRSVMMVYKSLRRSMLILSPVFNIKVVFILPV